MIVKLSPIVGEFNVDILQYMYNLKFIDISGCNSLKPDEFVKALGACTKLSTIVMQSCNQFSAWNILKMSSTVPTLTYIDSLGCCPMLSVTAYQIVTNSKIIKVLRVEPKKEKSDKKNWSQLRSMFLDVDFGPTVKSFVESTE